MARSDKSRHNRHHTAHPLMKKSYNRKMRHLVRQALSQGNEPVIKMAGFKEKGYCCGNHLSDWRY